MMDTAQEKMQELQNLEKSMQSYSNQKQQLQAQHIEIESAISELENTDTSYKIVGNIMVASSKDKLKKELNEKKELVENRISTIDKYYTDIQSKYRKLHEEMMSNLKEGSDNDGK
mgnify:CR=1 FL=1